MISKSIELTPHVRQHYQDLASSSPEKRNWFTVAALVCGNNMNMIMEALPESGIFYVHRPDGETFRVRTSEIAEVMTKIFPISKGYVARDDRQMVMNFDKD